MQKGGDVMFVIMSNEGPWNKDHDTVGTVGLCDEGTIEGLYDFVEMYSNTGAKRFNYFNGDNTDALEKIQHDNELDVPTVGRIIAFAAERYCQSYCRPCCYFVVDVNYYGPQEE